MLLKIVLWPKVNIDLRVKTIKIISLLTCSQKTNIFSWQSGFSLSAKSETIMRVGLTSSSILLQIMP